MADCSKTLDFLREFYRMCETYMDCYNCPLSGKGDCDPSMTKFDEKQIDIVQEWSDEHPDIKPCPFCGKSECVEVCSDDEDNDGVMFDETQFQVVCNAIKGGCGSSSGFRKTKEEALELWNKRVDAK